MRKIDILCIIIILSAFTTVLSAFAATDNFYELSESAQATWDGTNADRLKPKTLDYTYTYGDEASVTYTLPWVFNYYGRNFSQITCDTNGNIWFYAKDLTRPLDLASTGREHVLSAWNNDLSSSYYGGVFVQHKIDPERVVVEWQTETYTEEGFFKPNIFEIVLYPTGVIHADYKSFATTNGKDFGSGISKGDLSGIFLSLTTNYGTVFSLGGLGGRSFQFVPTYVDLTAQANGSFGPVALPDAVVGTFYSQSVTADIGEFGYSTWSGMPRPYVWSLKWCSYLPDGLTLNETTGVISGTPTQGGVGLHSFYLDVQAPDSSSGLWLVTINVAGITTISLPPGKAYMPYSETLTTTGLAGPFTWSVNAGSLPAGLSLSASTGIISGTPTATGCNRFTVQVKNSLGKAPKSTLVLCTTTPPVRIANKAGYLTIKEAYAAAVDNDVIQIQAQTFAEDLVTDDIRKSNSTITLDGGYSSDFSTNNGTTIITGVPHIVGGTVKMKNIRIQN